MSNSFSNFDRQQSEDRIYRAGQKRRVKIFNLMAVGGEKKVPTMDHYIWDIVREKKNVSEETSEQIIDLLKAVS